MLESVTIFCDGAKTRDPASGNVAHVKHKPCDFVFERNPKGHWESLHQINLGNPGEAEQAILAADVEDRGIPWEKATAHRFIEVPKDAVPEYKRSDRAVYTKGRDDALVSRARGGVRRTRRGYELECHAHTFNDGLHAVSFGELRRVLDTLADHDIARIDIVSFMRRLRAN